MKYLNSNVLLVFFLAIMLYSCKSNKEMVYFQNIDEHLEAGISYSALNYKLQKGDNLYIQVASINSDANVLFNPSLSSSASASAEQQYGSLTSQFINGFQVDQEGNIDLPIIGKVYVFGKTVSEAKQLVSTIVDEYFKEAVVSVKLLSFKYTVMGEVEKPGVFYNYKDKCTLLEAISNASGTTDYARLKKILVLRESVDGPRSINVDLTDKAVLGSEAYYLHPNDVIYVSPEKFKRTRLNASMYSLMLSTISTLIVLLKFLGS